MDTPDPSPALVVGGLTLLLVLVMAREVAAGAPREAGKELWARLTAHRGPIAIARAPGPFLAALAPHAIAVEAVRVGLVHREAARPRLTTTCLTHLCTQPWQDVHALEPPL